MTQEELAEKAHCSKRAIEYAEQHGHRVRIRTHYDIAEALGVAPAEIVASSIRPIYLASRRVAFLGVFLLASVVQIGSLPGRRQVVIPTAIGRFLASASSERQNFKLISLSHSPHSMAISPDGSKVFASSYHGNTLSILNTRNDTLRTLRLPSPSGPLAVSSEGRLYIGSSVDGVMIVDPEKEQLQPIIPTGGPVVALALSPDGAKLFLAMSQFGLKRLKTQTAALDQISDRICPEYLQMAPQGKDLYVAYQCSGPSGRRGHDSVEIIDVQTERSKAIIAGPPMVSGEPSVSPGGKLVLLDGSDACWNPTYDHAGCPLVPSHVVHLLRASDRKILWTFGFPGSTNGLVRFLDDSRFIVLNDSISVVDARKYTVLERWDGGHRPDFFGQSFVVAPDGRRAYLGGATSSILILNPESAECIPLQQGLAVHYAADGTLDDSVNLSQLGAHGPLGFTPGRVGQAFSFGGSTLLSTAWTGRYKFGEYDSTLSLYVKFSRREGEMSLVEWRGKYPRPGFRLMKSATDHFLFQSLPNGSPLESITSARPDTWYQVAVSQTDGKLVLYVNGEREASGLPPPALAPYSETTLFLGGNGSGGSPLFGWLDEVAFYERALMPKEVKALYEFRESGPCKL